MNDFRDADKIWLDLDLATMSRSTASSNDCSQGYGVQQSMALAVKNGRISAIASMAAIDESLLPKANIAGRGLQGVPYEQIAREGGGILSTVRATREASEQQLFDLAVPRLQALMSEGVTTLEIKSGYGLTFKDELKMLRVARQLGEAFPVQVRTTLLGAHALPPEFLASGSDAYIDLVCEQMIPAAAEQKLADAVDG